MRYEYVARMCRRADAQVPRPWLSRRLARGGLIHARRR